MDVTGEIQEPMVVEMTEMIKKRGGDALDDIYKSRGYIEGVTWENIWKHKSGLVTGVDVNYHAP